MRRVNIILSIFFVTFLLIGCLDNPANPESDEVEASIDEESIIVHNKLDKPVYYFAVESELAKTINWVPHSSEENKLKTGSQKHIPLSDITNYETGKKVIFSYWTTTNPKNSELNYLVIE